MLPQRMLAIIAIVFLPLHFLHAQWVRTEGPNVVSLLATGTELLGATDTGIVRSLDGVSWVMPASDTLFYKNLLGYYNGKLFAGTNHGVLVSPDSGLSWHQASTGLPPDRIYAFGQLGTTIFAGSNKNGVFRTTDNGQNWIAVNNGITNRHIAGLYADGATLYAGSRDSWPDTAGIFRSTNNGESWERASQGIGNYAQVSTFIRNGPYLFVNRFRSSDGLTWTPIGSSTMNLVSSLAAVTGGHLFAAADSGVYYSSDYGSTWQIFNLGLVGAASESQHIYSSTGTFNMRLAIHQEYLYVSLQNAGIWRRPLHEMIGQSAVTQLSAPGSVLTCSPNPFATTTHIRFKPEFSGYAKISIVNLLGIEVAQLFSGTVNAAEHTFTWHTSKALPAGLYQCLVQMNGKTYNTPLRLTR